MFLGRCFFLVIFCTTIFINVSANISQQISDATTQFSVDLLKTMLHDSPGNAVVSPVSIYTLLAILQQGTRSNSRTELNNVLHALPDETKEGYHNLTTNYANAYGDVTLHFATRAFVRTETSILQEFKQSLVTDFHSDIETLNFGDPSAAAQHINTWVAHNTLNRITELFSPDSIQPDTALVVTNAVYFMSKWANTFSEAINRTFSPRPNEEIQVLSMYHDEYYRSGVDTELGAKWVHMTLQGGVPLFSVLLVLPTERHGLDNLVNRLTAENLTTLFSHSNVNHVKLTLPKFRLNTDSNMIPLLRQLGVNDIFLSSADLSGISEQPLQVSKVVQKAEIAVDEKGVTAAAASGFVGVFLSIPYYPDAIEIEFKADEPFLFFIVDQENSVPLFAGRVSNPSSQ